MKYAAPEGGDHNRQGGLFGRADEQPVPKKPRRKGVHKTNLQRLEEQLKDFPKYTYTATDNDLPLIFWPEESFE